MGRHLDHPQQQGDARGIVDPGLSLQDRAGAPADLAAPEHREHHGGVGRRQCRPQHSGHLPVQAQHQVSGQGHPARSGEGAEHSQGGDVSQ